MRLKPVRRGAVRELALAEGQASRLGELGREVGAGELSGEPRGENAQNATGDREGQVGGELALLKAARSAGWSREAGGRSGGGRWGSAADGRKSDGERTRGRRTGGRRRALRQGEGTAHQTHGSDTSVLHCDREESIGR